MRRALLPALLLLVSGCAMPGALQQHQTDVPAAAAGALFDLGKVLELSIPVEDKTHLHGTVYLPKFEDGRKVPVIMDMGPYYGNLGPETNVYSKEHPPSMLYEHFLRHGYAIALVSVRGTGQSEGCFMIGGAQERADAAATVEWLATQAWSDGNVAMTGVSYDGTTPWEAYVTGAPHLKAVVPVEGISDFYRYSFFEGVPIGGGAAFNTYYLNDVDTQYGQSETRVPPDPNHVATNVPPWVTAQPSGVCPGQADVYTDPYKTYQDGVHDAFWDERDMSNMTAKATAAIFLVHGTKDFNVKMDHVQTMWDRLTTPKRMLLGQWEHNIPWRNSYDKNQSWAEYNATITQFLDAYVRDDATALAAEKGAPPVLVQDSANKTWNLTEWPPAASKDTRAYLGAPGKLSWAPASAGKATMRTSAAREAAIQVDGTTPLPLGLSDTTPTGAIVFESEPFAEDTMIMGNPWIDLQVTVDRPEGWLQAELYETGEKTKSNGLITEGWQNLATRESRDKTSDVPTGAPMKVRILLEGVAQHVEKGHTLKLVISPEMTDSLTPHEQITTFDVTLGGPDGASLMLPMFAMPS